MRKSLPIILLALVACTVPVEGGDAPELVAAFPVAIEAANGTVTINHQPTRIVSLSPAATEMLFAIGAGDQVIATDELSNYPPEAPVTELSGFEPNVEAITGYEPDLVVFSDDLNDIADGLDSLDIPALQTPAASVLDDSYEQMRQLGDATGHPDEADALVERVQNEIDVLAAAAPRPDPPLTYYYELDQSLYSATSQTFIGQVLALLGLENIADPADADGTGYPQLSAEAIVDADPDVIFLADTKCCGQSDATVAERPGWGGIAAVRNGAVIELDDDIASRWGPRVVDLFRAAAEGIEGLADAA